MTAKAAQAIFSIKPYEYNPRSTDIGEEYLEQGKTPTRAINKAFADRSISVRTPRSRAPWFMGGSRRGGHRHERGHHDNGHHVRHGRKRGGHDRTPRSWAKGSPYKPGYFNPYSRDAPKLGGGGGPGGRGNSDREFDPMASTRGEGRPYDPRKGSGGGVRPRNPRLARLLRALNTGPFENSRRSPYRAPYDSNRRGPRNPFVRGPRSLRGRKLHPRERTPRSRNPRERTPRGRYVHPYLRSRRHGGGNGLLAMGDSYVPAKVAAKQFHPRIANRSPPSRGVVPKKLRPKFAKIAKRLAANKEDLEDAEEDAEEAVTAGLNPAEIKDDGELGKKEGLMLPEAKKKYEKKIAEDRAELAKIPTVFPDKGILGGGPEDTMDDIIPNEVVSKVYRLVPGPASRPEGEPITDFLHNGWNPLNGVADP